MELEGKEGEYVRTIGGLIGKIIEKTDNTRVYKIHNCQEDDNTEIVKHSFNIIDLIEVRRLCKWRTS